jgi:hypothetical protein
MIQRGEVFGLEYTTYYNDLFLVADFYRGVGLPSLKINIMTFFDVVFINGTRPTIDSLKSDD